MSDHASRNEQIEELEEALEKSRGVIPTHPGQANAVTELLDLRNSPRNRTASRNRQIPWFVRALTPVAALEISGPMPG